MHITKMQGLGNDYIYLNCLETVPEACRGWRFGCPTGTSGWGATASSPSGPV